MDRAPLDEVKAVFGNLGSSNEARLALLEKRFMVPPSPAGSGDAVGQASMRISGNNDSIHSIGSGLQEHSTSLIQTPQGSLMEDSQDGQDDEQTNKKRRLQPNMNVSGFPKRENSTTPSAGNRILASSHLNVGSDGPKAPGSTPGSKGKQKNTIGRYFSTVPGSDLVQRSIQDSPIGPTAAAPANTVQRALEKEFQALR